MLHRILEEATREHLTFLCSVIRTKWRSTEKPTCDVLLPPHMLLEQINGGNDGEEIWQSVTDRGVHLLLSSEWRQRLIGANYGIQPMFDGQVLVTCENTTHTQTQHWLSLQQLIFPPKKMTGAICEVEY